MLISGSETPSGPFSHIRAPKGQLRPLGYKCSAIPARLTSMDGGNAILAMCNVGFSLARKADGQAI